MSKRVLILDTSVLCCWLQVPGKDEAGPVDDRWDHARIAKLLENERSPWKTVAWPTRDELPALLASRPA